MGSLRIFVENGQIVVRIAAPGTLTTEMLLDPDGADQAASALTAAARTVRKESR